MDRLADRQKLHSRERAVLQQSLESGTLLQNAQLQVYKVLDDWANHDMRSLATQTYGMWAMVDLHWTGHLYRKYLIGKQVLEIMAGAGWLAKALEAHGANIRATDSMRWHKLKEWQCVHPVEKMTSNKAVRTYGKRSDVLICSWPPYESQEMTRACQLFGPGKTIIYIGEGVGGCNADETFFNGFIERESFNIPQWSGMHDSVYIGQWYEKLD